MGREIRRVPPNWKHPIKNCSHYPRCDTCYQPMHETFYPEAAEEWVKNFIEFEANKKNGVENEYGNYYWEYENPPEEEYCVPYNKEEATWYQVYETVSEGTPVTPPFETQEELVEYLINHGDFWAQKRNEGGFSREAAENFVYKYGFAPSMVMNNGVLTVGIDSCVNMKGDN